MAGAERRRCAIEHTQDMQTGVSEPIEADIDAPRRRRPDASRPPLRRLHDSRREQVPTAPQALFGSTSEIRGISFARRCSPVIFRLLKHPPLLYRSLHRPSQSS